MNAADKHGSRNGLQMQAAACDEYALEMTSFYSFNAATCSCKHITKPQYDFIEKIKGQTEMVITP